MVSASLVWAAKYEAARISLLVMEGPSIRLNKVTQQKSSGSNLLISKPTLIQATNRQGLDL